MRANVQSIKHAIAYEDGEIAVTVLDRRAYLQWMALMALTQTAWAQPAARRKVLGWPTQPVNLIVPFPAGGPSAILAKHLAQSFERTTQQPLRLQYQGGAGGLQGASYAAKAPADGQNIFIGGSHLAVARAMVSNEEFDLMEDLLPLAMVATVPQVIVVNPARMRSRTVMEWLSDLGRKSARYRMATAGVGSSSHISAEILKHQESVRFEFVHFRGSGPALQDLLAGSVDMMIDGLVSCLPHIRSGRLKALMVTGEQRAAVLPDVPCAQEMGVDALNHVTWYGLFAPSDLSHAQANAMQQVFKRMGEDEVLAANFEHVGIRWGGIYGEAFKTMVQQETLQWAQRLKSMGLNQMTLKSPEVS